MSVSTVGFGLVVSTCTSFFESTHEFAGPRFKNQMCLARCGVQSFTAEELQRMRESKNLLTHHPGGGSSSALGKRKQ